MAKLNNLFVLMYFFMLKKKINLEGFYSSMHSNYVRETTGWWLNYQLYKTHFSCNLQLVTAFPLNVTLSLNPFEYQNKPISNIWTNPLFWEKNEIRNISCLKKLTYPEGHIGSRVWLFKVSQFRSLILDILNLLSLLRLKTISSAILIFWGYNF